MPDLARDLLTGCVDLHIDAVGAEHVVMATDFGQVDSPPAPEGMRWYIEQMLDCGIPAERIELMTKRNPLRLGGHRGAAA